MFMVEILLVLTVFLNINSATTVVEGSVNELKIFVLKLLKYEYDKAVEKTEGNTPSNVLGSKNLMKFRLFLKMVFKALKMATETGKNYVGLNIEKVDGKKVENDDEKDYDGPVRDKDIFLERVVHFSEIIKINDITESNNNPKEFWKSIEEQIENRFNKVLNTHFDCDDYTADLQSIEITYAKAPREGCCINSMYKKEAWTKFKPLPHFPGLEYSFRAYSYKSSNNNCLFAVLNAKYNIKGNSYEGKNLPNEIRAELK